MPEETKISNPEEEEEYELLPHKEIEELKGELQKLKEFEITPTKKMQVSLLELNTKLDKLLTVFEDAMRELRVDEGGLSFAEKMKPLLAKMNKILEQNSEIASGILALADMVKELREKVQLTAEPAQLEPTLPMQPEMPPLPPMPFRGEMPPMQPIQAMQRPLQGMPPLPPPGFAMAPPGVPPGQPLPPVPRRRTFGI